VDYGGPRKSNPCCGELGPYELALFGRKEWLG